MNPFKYDTGFDLIDRILSIVAYLVAVAGLACCVILFGSIVWVHWKIYA